MDELQMNKLLMRLRELEHEKATLLRDSEHSDNNDQTMEYSEQINEIEKQINKLNNQLNNPS